MFQKVCLISLILFSASCAQQQQRVPINNNDVRTLRQITAMYDMRFDHLPAFAFGMIALDSSGDSPDYDTVEVVDSLGDTIYFSSQTEWFVVLNVVSNVKGPSGNSFGTYPQTRTVSDFQFQVSRAAGGTWDTLQYLAIGKRRRR